MDVRLTRRWTIPLDWNFFTDTGACLAPVGGSRSARAQDAPQGRTFAGEAGVPRSARGLPWRRTRLAVPYPWTRAHCAPLNPQACWN